MIWYDMSYNRFDDFLDRLFNDNFEEDVDAEDESNKASGAVFSGNGCLLFTRGAIYSQSSIETL